MGRNKKTTPDKGRDGLIEPDITSIYIFIFMPIYRESRFMSIKYETMNMKKGAS